jgi:hypothetical protein
MIDLQIIQNSRIEKPYQSFFLTLMIIIVVLQDLVKFLGILFTEFKVDRLGSL